VGRPRGVELRGAPPTSPQVIDPPPQVPIQARLGLLLGSRLLVRYPLPHHGQSEPVERIQRGGASERRHQQLRCLPTDLLARRLGRYQWRATEGLAVVPTAPGPATSCTVAGRSARVLDGADDLGREFGVGQKLVDECGENLLASYAGDSEAVGRCSLPDVEGSVCGGWEVDGASRSLGACWLIVCSMVDWLLGDRPLHGFLSEAREALGWRCVWVDVHCAPITFR
jgi:hypothetical protein